MEKLTTKNNKQEFFTIKPNLKQFVGITITKETNLEEEVNDYTKQTLKDLVLTTYINKESVYDKIKTNEKTELSITLKEGMVLIYQEGEGYILPSVKFCSIEEVITESEEVINIYKNLIIEE